MSDLYLIRSAAPDLWFWRKLGPNSEITPVVSGTFEEAQTHLRDQRLILVLPGENISWHKVDLPLKGPRLLAAAPFALEDGLAEDVDSLHFSMAPARAGDRAVYVVSRDWLTEQLERAEELAPQELVAAVPEALLLPETENGPLLACLNDDRLIGIGLDGVQTTLPAFMGDRFVAEQGPEMQVVCVGPTHPPREVSITQRVDAEDLLALTPNIARLRSHSLLHGAFARESRNIAVLKPLLWPAALLAAVVVLHTSFSALLLWQLKDENNRAYEQAESTFKQTFPDITRIVDMRIQASQRLAAARGSGSASTVLELMKDSSQALRSTPQLSLDNVQFRDKALYLSLSGENLQALEQLRSKLEKQPRLRLEVQSAQAGSDGVQIRLKLEKA